ncbi:MAG: phosphomannomutase/phosphoglucomutase [Acidobacteriota bacterium]|nr:MAG: phosphomannomutase/phosphoglucomutase [Acidobacteriota bacterium]
MSLNPHIFREYDIRGIVGQDLTARSVAELATAIGTFFRKNGAQKIAIGYDARESSPEFESVLSDGLRASGIDVISIGRVSTPVLYHTVHTQNVDGGIMITGSHNPPEYNGFKICLGKEALFGDQIREIRSIAESGERFEGEGSREEIEVLDEYLDDLAARVGLGSRKLKAVIDSGNGMGAVTAIPLYERLGIELVELYSEPDPAFPNHHPDPTVEENLVDLIEAVRSSRSDVGIAFDGDGDRIGVVDEKGRVIWGDELMIVYSRAVLEESPGATIIGEVKCSQTLYDDIEKYGGKPLMWKAGHSLIKAKMKETGSVLAGEMSGHIFFADRFYGFDDAAYAGARLFEILSRTVEPLGSLLSDVPETFSTPEIRIPCPEDKKTAVVEAIAEEFSRTQDVITIDGARISFEGGWGLVRASNTQAILVLRFEADSPERLEEIRNRVTGSVEGLLGG